MSVQPVDDGRGASLERSREEHLQWDRPSPPFEELAIEDLTDEEAEAFWAAITAL